MLLVLLAIVQLLALGVLQDYWPLGRPALSHVHQEPLIIMGFALVKKNFN